VKVVVGLGNPGSEYDATRHNVGWWVADRLVHDWRFGPYSPDGPSLVSEGRVRTHDVWVVKPTVYMNRSGVALARLCRASDLDVSRDLLVVVDDATLDVGRIRLRRSGGAGGHNGLKSVEAGLGTQEYARLRIGVGQAPDGVDLVEWVLSPMPPADEDVVLTRVSELREGVEIWMEEGVEAAMNHLNR
jgi:PTH1 family peptidyl-tRNA hydrolase